MACEARVSPLHMDQKVWEGMQGLNNFASDFYVDLHKKVLMHLASDFQS